eukprot:GHVL01012106.1.p1 GENE.GHVL01012106.1~~GHVL01012106.1.p1  ORF type:complete len:113 (+),score=32.54 GHVL01012106.1:171-509(+)
MFQEAKDEIQPLRMPEDLLVLDDMSRDILKVFDPLLKWQFMTHELNYLSEQMLRVNEAENNEAPTKKAKKNKEKIDEAEKNQKQKQKKPEKTMQPNLLHAEAGFLPTTPTYV